MTGYQGGKSNDIQTKQGLRDVQTHGFIVGEWIKALTRKPTCHVCGREFRWGEKGIYAFSVRLVRPIRLCEACGMDQAEEEERLIAQARSGKP